LHNGNNLMPKRRTFKQPSMHGDRMGRVHHLLYFLKFGFGKAARAKGLISVHVRIQAWR
jgi:hypothetical protein